MEKVLVFLDYANLNASARSNNCQVDCAGLLEYLASADEGRNLKAAFAYVPIDPRQEHAQDAVIDELWGAGYVVKSKVGTFAGPSYKCDFDVEITLDIVRAAYDMQPDIVVLVSGDSDFVPVVLNLREKGIRVEVAAFNSAMSGRLSQRCSGFICLDAVAGQGDAPLDAVAGQGDAPADEPEEESAPWDVDYDDFWAEPAPQREAPQGINIPSAGDDAIETEIVEEEAIYEVGEQS